MKDDIIDGALVGIELPGKKGRLDGFWSHGRATQQRLLVLVHGLGGNYYRSSFKKAFMRLGLEQGWDVLSFNNRGHTTETTDERFSDCVADLDSVLRFGRNHGYRDFGLVGHSTGCQKITYYQAKRQRHDVSGLVLAAPADDRALAQRDLGPRYGYWVQRARNLVASGKGETRMPAVCHGFTARRFLSCSDSRYAEAKVFDYSGPLKQFRKVTTPILAFFGSDEEFACLPVDEMGRVLKEKTNSVRFRYFTVEGANHGFKGCETRTVRRVYRWLDAN